VTEITDSAGVINTRTYEEEPGSAAIRVTDISGACPTCGYGPDTDFEYTDPGNPLLPTAAIDAEGVETAMIYDANGRLVLRIEAVGLAEERTTTWQYDANFPAFPTVIEQPSVEPGELRTLTNVYDASTGDLLSRTQDGFEGGVALSGQTTVFTYDSSGQVSTLDPPGFGTTDQTVLHYDDPNLNGQIPTRRTDPLVGDSHLFYDPFNRRNATVDPNGMRVETDYDELDRVTAVRQCKVATPSDTCATPLGQVLSTSHAYNEFGDLAVTTLPRGNAISYSYDPVGRLIAIERKADPLPGTHGERTFYTLDVSGNREREEQQIWNGTGWTTLAQTSFEYQNRCQVQKVISGLPGEESITEYSRRMSR
jgi:YD repeat-containing protein